MERRCSRFGTTFVVRVAEIVAICRRRGFSIFRVVFSPCGVPPPCPIRTLLIVPVVVPKRIRNPLLIDIVNKLRGLVAY